MHRKTELGAASIVHFDVELNGLQGLIRTQPPIMCAGPLSRDLLTSGIEGLAPSNSLPEHNLAALKTASSMMTSPDTSRQQSPYADRTAPGMHTRNDVRTSSWLHALGVCITVTAVFANHPAECSCQ